MFIRERKKTMNLIEYEGKNVKIIDTKERVWEGKVTDYIYPEDNEPEVESIIIKCKVGRFPGKLIEFTGLDIESIEVLE